MSLNGKIYTYITAIVIKYNKNTIKLYFITTAVICMYISPFSDMLHASIENDSLMMAENVSQNM
jgi:hypothetical protein